MIIVQREYGKIMRCTHTQIVQIYHFNVLKFYINFMKCEKYNKKY